MARRWRWGLAGVVLVLVGAWLAVGLTPSVGLGVMTQHDLESVEDEDTWPDDPPLSFVVDPSDGTYDGLWTFRNEGLLPVTVRLSGHGQSSLPQWDATLHPYDERLNVVGDAADTVHVGPDGSFAVTFAWGPGCVELAPGTTLIKESVGLAVNTLGLTRTLDAPADHQVGFQLSEEHVPPAGCEG